MEETMFIYNEQNTYAENFRQWKLLNDIEREAWGMEQFSNDEAAKVFDSIYKFKVDND